MNQTRVRVQTKEEGGESDTDSRGPPPKNRPKTQDGTKARIRLEVPQRKMVTTAKGNVGGVKRGDCVNERGGQERSPPADSMQ